MSDVIYPLLGAALLAVGFSAAVTRRHVLLTIIAVNIMASGVSLLLLTLPARAHAAADPVPQAMVLTGIVVMVAATALGLALAVRLTHATAVEAAHERHADPSSREPQHTVHPEHAGEQSHDDTR